MNTHPNNVLKILQLLLRCGMVCREELNVVLEMMPTVRNGRQGAMEKRTGTLPRTRKASQPPEAMERREATALPSRQPAQTFEFDKRV